MIRPGYSFCKTQRGDCLLLCSYLHGNTVLRAISAGHRPFCRLTLQVTGNNVYCGRDDRIHTWYDMHDGPVLNDVKKLGFRAIHATSPHLSTCHVFSPRRQRLSTTRKDAD